MNGRKYAAAAGTVLLWSSAFPAVRFCMKYYSPEALMLFRFLVASVFLLGYNGIKKVKPPDVKDLPMFAAAGFFGIFLYMWAFNTGTNMVNSGISGFIIASAPVFTLILSIIFLKEKAKPLVWVGVLISFAGIVIIGSTQIIDTQLNTGVWLLVAAAVLTSIFNIIQRNILRKYSAMQSVTYSITFATLFMCFFFPNLIREFAYAPLSVNIAVVYLGLFPAALAYLMWSYALSKTDKTVHVTSFLYLTPFLASVIAFLWLGETMPGFAVLGGIVIISGMVLTNFVR